MECDDCGRDTCEWSVDDGKNRCPKCYQDLQEIGSMPLTRHANVHDCAICGELVREYGFKVKIGGEMWVCMKCMVVE